jgi:hypothetical protein
MFVASNVNLCFTYLRLDMCSIFQFRQTMPLETAYMFDGWCLIYVFFNFRSTMVSKHSELAKIRPGMWEVLFSIKPTGSMPHQPSSLSRMYATPAIPLLLPCVSRINAAPALLPGTSRMYAPPTTSKKSTARRLCWRLH